MKLIIPLLLVSAVCIVAVRCHYQGLTAANSGFRHKDIAVYLGGNHAENSPETVAQRAAEGGFSGSIQYGSASLTSPCTQETAISEVWYVGSRAAPEGGVAAADEWVTCFFDRTTRQLLGVRISRYARDIVPVRTYTWYYCGSQWELVE